MSNPLLVVRNLFVGTQSTRIVKGASLEIAENEIVALVGESGSGKSMIARSIMNVLPSTAISVTDGEIVFQNKDLLNLSEGDLRKLRGRSIAYIPQSPLNSLNPIMSIGRQLEETYDSSCFSKQGSAKERALFLLKRVGFLDPDLAMKSLPYQLSGGMRQRVLIAMALMNSPKLLIADEPTTALDVTLQAEILDLLQDLKDEYGLSILLITHDLGIVARCAEKVVILCSGQTIETGDVFEIFYNPKHEYTQNLIESLIYIPKETAAV